MATEFDKRKALSEQLTGYMGVHRVIDARRRDAERRLGEAEAEVNALAKLEAFAKELLNECRRQMAELDEQR